MLKKRKKNNATATSTCSDDLKPIKQIAPNLVPRLRGPHIRVIYSCLFMYAQRHTT